MSVIVPPRSDEINLSDSIDDEEIEFHDSPNDLFDADVELREVRSIYRNFKNSGCIFSTWESLLLLQYPFVTVHLNTTFNFTALFLSMNNI